MYDIFDAAPLHEAQAYTSYDPNETLADAVALTEGFHEINGFNVDWYELEMQAGAVTLTMTPTGTRDALNMVLYNSDGNPIRADRTATGVESIVFNQNVAGTYYLQITDAQFGETPPSGGISYEYTLDIDLPQVVPADGNNTMVTATPLTEGSHDILGREVDWHRIDASAGYLTVTMTEIQLLDDAADTRDDPRNLQVILYDGAGNAVKQAPSSGTSETFTYLIPEDGPYFVKVITAQFGDNAPDGTVLSYNLTLDMSDPVTPDGNDSLATAQALAEGTHAIAGTGQDWFRVEALSGVFSASITPDDATWPDGRNVDLNLQLVRSDGHVLAGSTGTGGTEGITDYVLSAADTYYLRVFRADHPDGVENTELNYSLTLDLPEASVSDGNDSQADAELLATGTTTHSGTGVDWYRFDSLSGMMGLSLTELGTQPNGNPMRLNVVLYNASGEELTSVTTLEDTKSLSDLLEADGTYYLKVFWAPYPDGAPSGVTLDYELTLSLPTADVSDGNDSRETAETLTAGTLVETSGTGVDWYRFESGPGLLEFEMLHTGTFAPDGRELDLNMELYDLGGTVIRSGFQSLADESFVHLAQTSQTYYLKVYWAPFENGAPNGVALDYTLNLDLPQGTWSTELDFGPVRGGSVSVYDIDRDGLDEIFVSTAKALDPVTGAEIRPGGLIVLEDDGTVKWSITFPGFDGPDPDTGLTYNTSSVTTAPVFSDVNGDAQIDILVGTGADNRGEFSASGQPGDLGGLYAVSASGELIWSFNTIDSFGSASGGPDGRPDGVYGAPRVFDIDADGQREVLFTSWDHYLYAVNGKTGVLEFKVDLHDTLGATPNVADLNNDGLYEIVVPGDITDNPRAGIDTQGGILHILSNYGQHNVPGWDTQIFSSTDADFRGQWEEQSLWSSPQVVDLNRDGVVEIVQGTGNFFQDERGQYVKVWNADGTLRFQLDTVGRVLASPLIADLDGNGSMEIVAATIDGHVHAWNAAGVELFDATPRPFRDGAPVTDVLPIGRSPIAVDLDNDGDLEILVSVGSQMVVLDSDGTQLTSTTQAEYVYNTYGGSPVAHDIDGDGVLDLISGGTTEAQDQAVIYRWENIADVTSSTYRTAEYQDMQSLHNVQSFVDRFYDIILGRTSDAGGRNYWTDLLITGVMSGAEVSQGFIASREFTNRATSNAEFIEVLYNAFFDRAPSATEVANWERHMDGGTTRDGVLSGFTGSREFLNIANSYGIRVEASFGAYSDAAVIQGDPGDTSLLRGGAGDNILFDEGSGVAETNSGEKNIAGQVYRLYGAVLGRGPDAGGFVSWFDNLRDGNVVELQVAGAFMNSREFTNTYGSVSDAEFIELLYQNVLGRDPSQTEVDNWLRAMTRETNPMERANVVLGFSDSREYTNGTNAGLDSYMLQVNPEWVDVLEGGAGDDQMNGGSGSDIFVFRNGQGGSDTIHGFEPWDRLQLSGFGLSTAAQAIANMTQQGGDVVFDLSGQTITFLNTTLAEMNRVQYNLS